MSVLVCENVSTKFIEKEFKDDFKPFNFNFLEKQVYALLGRSDSGIHSLLNALGGKEKAKDGEVYLDGEKLYKNKLVSNRICYISNKTTFPSLARISDIFSQTKRIYPKWDNFLAYKLLDIFSLKDTLTFGQIPESKRSIFLGILAIATRANVTIFDDPVFNTDAKERYDFFNELYKHHQIYPRTIIIATNYIDDMDYLVDNILFIEKGKIISQFKLSDIKNDFRYLSGKKEVLKSLISGVKVIGFEERGNELTVCIRKKLSKDDIRKYQKYMIKISEVPIQKVFVYLLGLREKKGID